MAQKRDKTQKAWIVILAFCLFVFITLDCGLVYYEMVERQVPLKEMARPIVVLSVITWAAYNALRQRIQTHHSPKS